jgi:hypothetical protein
MRQHTSSDVSIRQRTSAYVDAIVQDCSAATYNMPLHPHTAAYVSSQHSSAHVRIRQHTSAYVSIRQHTSAYVSIRQHSAGVLRRTLRHARSRGSRAALPMRNATVLAAAANAAWFENTRPANTYVGVREGVCAGVGWCAQFAYVVQNRQTHRKTDRNSARARGRASEREGGRVGGGGGGREREREREREGEREPTHHKHIQPQTQPQTQTQPQPQPQAHKGDLLPRVRLWQGLRLIVPNLALRPEARAATA